MEYGGAKKIKGHGDGAQMWEMVPGGGSLPAEGLDTGAQNELNGEDNRPSSSYPPDGLDYKVKNQFCVIVWQRVWVCYIFHLSNHLKNSAFS